MQQFFNLSHKSEAISLFFFFIKIHMFVHPKIKITCVENSICRPVGEIRHKSKLIIWNDWKFSILFSFHVDGIVLCVIQLYRNAKNIRCVQHTTLCVFVIFFFNLYHFGFCLKTNLYKSTTFILKYCYKFEMVTNENGLPIFDAESFQR